MDEEYATEPDYKKKTPGDMQKVMDSNPPPSQNDLKTIKAVVVGGN